MALGNASSGDPEAATKLYVCATCGKQYQRNTHLRRHEATHTQVKRFECPHCDASFFRSDVCKRHRIWCAGRHGLATSSVPLKRGRQNSACVHCAKSKVGCDGGRPCTRCTTRSLACQYPKDMALREPKEEDVASSHVIPDAPSRNNLTPPSTVVSPASTSSSNPTVSSGSSRGETKLPFLEKFMDPSKNIMLEYFAATDNDGSINEVVSEDAANVRAQYDEMRNMQDLADVATLFPEQYQSMLDDMLASFSPDEDLDMLSLSMSSSPIPALTDDGFARLEARCGSLIDVLESVRDGLPEDAATAFDMTDAKSIFNPESIRAFTATFFRFGHVHFPIIHPSTFGDENTSTPLLLAVIMGGAFRSTPSKQTNLARSFSYPIEEYIFSKINTLSQLPPSSSPPSTETLQLLQAGIMMAYLMFLTNYPPTRKRGRLHRLPQLIAAVRGLELFSKQFSLSRNWKDFVYQETTVRVATWAALADWHYAVSFYYPPLVAGSEVQASFPCHQTLWDAPDATAYILQLETLQPPTASPATKTPTSIREFISALMDNKFTIMGTMVANGVTIETLYTVTVAFNSLAVFALQMGIMSNWAPVLLRALERWEALFAEAMAQLDEKTARKAGAARHAPETCILLRLIIVVFLKNPGHAYFQKIGHDSMHELYDIAKAAAAAEESEPAEETDS